MKRNPSPAELLSKQRQPRNGAPVRFEVVWENELKWYRDKWELSTRQVAAAVGMNNSTYWRIEQGADVTLRQAMQISEFFGKPIALIWTKKK